MTLSRWALKQDEQAECPIEAGRRVWIQVVRGKVVVNGQQAGTSDAFAVWDETALSIKADEDSEILLFDLPPV
ncbi:Quercetin 2,3-dioxygenase [compost metagenome]